MMISCKFCIPKEVEVPDFTQEDKERLIEMKSNYTIGLIKYIKTYYSMSLVDAKYIGTHINSEPGVCNRCKKNVLIEEQSNCPSCGAFNFNWQV